MFHPAIDPNTILKALMEDAIVTLERLLENGFPLNSVPPHHTSIYISTGADPQGVMKEDIHVLTYEDPLAWAPMMLSRLDEGRTDTRHALGSFLGFVGSAEKLPDEQLFFGILISPTGEDCVGMYMNLEDTSEIHTMWRHPYDLAPHLESFFIPSNSMLVH
jgi:hypothetical protein